MIRRPTPGLGEAINWNMELIATIEGVTYLISELL